jgi:mono/diheme cytochrome c family protein
MLENQRFRTEIFMLKNLFFVALAAAVAVGIGYADQTAGNVVVPVKKTQANDGKQMYVNYCAPCHGVDGRGNGPVSDALKTPPVNLTLLSRNNGGTFPAMHVQAVLEFGTKNSAHGTTQMPVWGPVLDKMDPNGNGPNVGVLRISNLGKYLESIQAK